MYFASILPHFTLHFSKFRAANFKKNLSMASSLGIVAKVLLLIETSLGELLNFYFP